MLHHFLEKHASKEPADSWLGSHPYAQALASDPHGLELEVPCREQDNFWKEKEAMRQKEEEEEEEEELRQKEDDIRQKEEALRLKEEELRQKEDAINAVALKEHTLRQKEETLRWKDEALSLREEVLRLKETAIRQKEQTEATGQKQQAILTPHKGPVASAERKNPRLIKVISRQNEPGRLAKQDLGRKHFIASYRALPVELHRVNYGPDIKVRVWKPPALKYDIRVDALTHTVQPKALDPATYEGE